jgi:glutamine---fructose-6-phosphate transaminase (isomerizing)
VFAGVSIEGKPVAASALADQAGRLGTDLRDLVPLLARQLDSLADLGDVHEVVLAGNGDSHHASIAAEHAFTTLAGLRCAARCAQRAADYPAADRLGPTTLVVGVSVSGNSPRVVEAVDRAAALGAVTLAVTGGRDGALAGTARHRVFAEPTDLRRGPGVRTHQANLLALLLLAIHIGQSRGTLGDVQADDLRAELVRTAQVVADTAELVGPACARLAPSFAAAPVRFLLGTGPGFGTAAFAAAKLVEAAGVPSFGQDIEEWWHVERFCRPTDLPVLLIAAPGPARDRAVATVRRAAGIDRRLLAVARHDDPDFDPGAVLPVAGSVREEFAPLVYSVFAPLLAAAVAAELGRQPFLADFVAARPTPPGGSPP